MEKSSTIKDVQYKNQYTGQHGIVHYHNIWMENGDAGQIGTKDQAPQWLQKGMPLIYEFIQTEQGNKIKKVNPKPQPNTGRPFDPAYDMAKQKMIVKQSSLKVAADYYVAHGKSGKDVTPQDITSLADLFTEWVMKP